jgi:hypothetical protein
LYVGWEWRVREELGKLAKGRGGEISTSAVPIPLGDITRMVFDDRGDDGGDDDGTFGWS